MAERIVKPWGWSQEVYRDELTRVVRIHVEPGGFCSVHKHERQDNEFVLLSGELKLYSSSCWSGIEHWERNRPYSAHAEYDLNEYYASHNWLHQFMSPTGCEALEIYTSADGTPPDENDIIRFSEGGTSNRKGNSDGKA